MDGLEESLNNIFRVIKKMEMQPVQIQQVFWVRFRDLLASLPREEQESLLLVVNHILKKCCPEEIC